MKGFALAVVALAVLSQQAAAPPSIDPVGKWTFATRTQDGQSATGALEITGKPGAYTGQSIMTGSQPLPITDVYTSPNDFILIVQLPSSFAVAKLTRGADGKFSGAWGEITDTMPITVERVGG